MNLLVYYVAFTLIGDLADYLIGLGVEHVWPDANQISLVVFLTLYFLFLWLAWVLAVWITEPKEAQQTPPINHRDASYHYAAPHYDEQRGSSGFSWRCLIKRLGALSDLRQRPAAKTNA